MYDLVAGDLGWKKAAVGGFFPRGWGGGRFLRIGGGEVGWGCVCKHLAWIGLNAKSGSDQMGEYE